MSEKKRTKDGMIKCSMTMNATFLQKLEILSYAMEAKYISVEVLPIQSLLQSTTWLSHIEQISKANSTSSSKNKIGKLKM